MAHGPPPRSRATAIAWSLAVTQTIGYGVLYYAFSVVTLPMEAELGWTRAQTSGAFSLMLLLSGVVAWPFGRLVDRRGARGLMTVGSLIGGGVVLAWSTVTSLPQLYVVLGGIGLVLAAVTYEVAFTVLAQWFRRADRIRALLIVTTLAGLASTIFIPLTQALVDGIGWRAALRVLAAVLWIGTVPLHAWVLRRAPEASAEDHVRPDAETSVGAAEAWRGGTFWWLTFAFGLDRMVAVAIGVHAVPLLLERGHPAALVAGVAGSIGLLQVVGRLIFAPAARHVSLARLTVATSAVRVASLASLLLVPGGVGLFAFAALFGLSNGAATLAGAGLVAEAFGPRHYGAIRGSMTSATTALQVVAPWGMGALRVAHGDYTGALTLLIVVAAIGGACIEVPRRRGAFAGKPV